MQLMCATCSKAWTVERGLKRVDDRRMDGGERGSEANLTSNTQTKDGKN
jgi:hypothetical protein